MVGSAAKPLSRRPSRSPSISTAAAAKPGPRIRAAGPPRRDQRPRLGLGLERRSARRRPRGRSSRSAARSRPPAPPAPGGAPRRPPPALGPVGAQELQPRRRGVEEVARLDHRAAGEGGRPRGAADPAGVTSIRAASAAPSARETSAAGPRRRARAAPRRGSRSAMSSRSAPSVFEVACRSSASARSSAGMPCPSSATRISVAAAAGDLHLHPPGAGVERVLHQLLDRRGGPLDHLAGRDAVCAASSSRRIGRRFCLDIGSGNDHTPTPSITGARCASLGYRRLASTPCGLPTTTKARASGSSSRAATRSISSSVTASTSALRSLT
jgi:hypothetical protein